MVALVVTLHLVVGQGHFKALLARVTDGTVKKWKSLRIAQLSTAQVCVEEAVHEHASAAFIRWVKDQEAKLRNKAVDIDTEGGSPGDDRRGVGSGVSGGTSATNIR